MIMENASESSNLPLNSIAEIENVQEKHGVAKKEKTNGGCKYWTSLFLILVFMIYYVVLLIFLSIGPLV